MFRVGRLRQVSIASRRRGTSEKLGDVVAVRRKSQSPLGGGVLRSFVVTTRASRSPSLNRLSAEGYFGA